VCSSSRRSYADARGVFSGDVSGVAYAGAGIVASVVQDNLSRSVCGTCEPHTGRAPQGKLVFIVRGRLRLAVDLRRSSRRSAAGTETVLSTRTMRSLDPRRLRPRLPRLSDVCDFATRMTAPYSPTTSDAALERSEPARLAPFRSALARARTRAGRAADAETFRDERGSPGRYEARVCRALGCRLVAVGLMATPALRDVGVGLRSRTTAKLLRQIDLSVTQTRRAAALDRDGVLGDEGLRLLRTRAPWGPPCSRRTSSL